MAEGFVAQMTEWQSGKAPQAGSPPVADSPVPVTSTPSGSAPATVESLPKETPTPAPGSPSPGSASTPPQGEQPPVTPAVVDSGAPKAEPKSTDPNADKRVSDAQAKMHEEIRLRKEAEAKVEATLAENTSLREQLGAVLTRSDLQPMTADAYDVDQAVKDVIAGYKKPAAEGGPKDDDEALALLVSKTLEVGDKRSRVQRLAEENQRREAARGILLGQAINTFVNSVDPDLPIELFWAILPRAEAETPAELRGPERFDWQVKRALAKSRVILDQRDAKVRESTLHIERTARAAEVVMPGGGAAPVTPAKAPERPSTMIDKLEQLQRRTMPSIA